MTPCTMAAVHVAIDADALVHTHYLTIEPAHAAILADKLEDCAKELRRFVAASTVANVVPMVRRA